MKTLAENTKQVGDSAYWGDRGQWLIALTQHRDSDALERSNWNSAYRELKRVDPEEQNFGIERFGHWAVGWVEYMVINPSSSELVLTAETMIDRLDNYPVLDEEDFSREESEEADEIWKHCYGTAERVKYIREHRSQFDFRDFPDMLNCVRGNYFAGYASELIN